jgi:hypothetical protein
MNGIILAFQNMPPEQVAVVCVVGLVCFIIGVAMG